MAALPPLNVFRVFFRFFPVAATGLALVWGSAAEAAAAPRVYYSVHVASFQNLKNANGFVNSLARTGKVVFWKEAQVPEKGLFYRVYLGRFADIEEAQDYWARLKAEGKVSYRGIHRFEGPVEPQPQPAADMIPDSGAVAAAAGARIPEAVRPPPAVTVGKPPPTPAAARPAATGKQPPKAAAPAPAPPHAGPAPVLPTPAKPLQGRFVDNGDGTVTDRESGLMWVRNGWRIDFFSAETWYEAEKKCASFAFAGHTDWRLPTLDQWRTIIDTAYECPALAEPNPFENIIVHMPYWSSTPVAKVPVKVYTVTLYYGSVTHLRKSDRAFILPVRSLN